MERDEHEPPEVQEEVQRMKLTINLYKAGCGVYGPSILLPVQSN